MNGATRAVDFITGKTEFSGVRKNASSPFRNIPNTTTARKRSHE